MQAQLKIKCLGCLKDVGAIKIDTADIPEKLQAKINKIILEHRKDCKYYRN